MPPKTHLAAGRSGMPINLHKEGRGTRQSIKTVRTDALVASSPPAGHRYSVGNVFPWKMLI